MQPKIRRGRESGRHRNPEPQEEKRPETNVSNPTAAQRQERNLDEILTCWRWARSLDHRLNVYQLQFQHDVAGALAIDHQALANEIGSFRIIAHGLAR